VRIVFERDTYNSQNVDAIKERTPQDEKLKGHTLLKGMGPIFCFKSTAPA